MDTEFYTAEEAMQKLNKPRSTFFKEVENGLIPFELEPGRQRGRRFPRQAIDILAKRQQTRFKQSGPTHLIFSPSSPADIWAEVQIGIELYGEDDIVPFETLLEWRDVNDEMYMSVKDRGRVAGYTSLMPIDESIMPPLIQDKIRERDIPTKSIKQWTDPHLSVYIASVTIKPTGNARRDKELGRFLIKNTVKWALALHRQYDIKNWYGIGATSAGQHLFEALGFTEIASVHEGERRGYILKEVKNPVNLINMFLKGADNE
ncbi:MAG: MerR family transcriptional regulator [Ktedonobacteraceae bacterium]